MNRVATLLTLGLMFVFVYSNCVYAQQPGLNAMVTALQGAAQSYAGADQNPKQLEKGDSVDVWNMLSTDAKSKVVLRWQNGLTGAIGEFSSVVLSSEEMEGTWAPGAEIINGIFRFAGPGASAGVMPSYSVTTPTVAIHPVDSGQPADFTVEVYDPKTTVVSVISGQVRVLKSTGEEKIVPSCHSYYIEEGKTGYDPFPLSSEDFGRLVEDTTIPGTFIAGADSCGPRAEAAPRGPEYAVPTDYYVEDWDEVDFYPYDFRIMEPPHAGGAYVVVIPGIGRWFIEIPYSIDPAFVKIYVEEVFLNHYVGFYHDHLARWRHRQHELAGVISLARLSGNKAMLMQAQQQLNDLNLRTRWATKRIHGLENKMTALGKGQHKLSGKLPADVNLRNLIATSLNTPKNSAVSRKFQDRLKTDVDVQKRLATLASQEISDFNKKIAAQPDPAKRLALRDQLSGIRNELASGKLVIPAKDKQIGSLVKELGKERDPGKQAQIEDRVLNQLKKVGAGPEAEDLLNQQRLTSMKQELTKFPNPKGRQVMEQQLSALQQTVEKRKESEAVAQQTSKQIEQLATQAATERNPERQNQILNQLNELSKSAPGVLPGLGRFVPQPSAGTKPPVQQQQMQMLQEKLEEQKKQTESQKQQQLQQQQLEQQKQTDLKKQEELRQQATEKQKQEQELKKQQLQQQQMERQKQEQELKKQQLQQQQLERQKQSELQQREKMQQQQLQRQQTIERQKQQQELKKQQLQQQQLERQKQSELQQQERLRQQQKQQMLQQQQQQQQQQQMRRSQQEQQKQLEMRRQSQPQSQSQQPSYQMQAPTHTPGRQQAVPQSGQPQMPKFKDQQLPGLHGQ